MSIGSLRGALALLKIKFPPSLRERGIKRDGDNKTLLLILLDEPPHAV